MGLKKKGLNLSDAEIAAAFADSEWGRRYPPVLSTKQAAELLQVPKSTLYAWNSQERLTGCAQRAGKHLLVFRDRLIKHIFNGGLNGEAK